MHIRIVSPVTTRDPQTIACLEQLQRPGLQLTAVEIREGPPSIESEHDEALAVPDTVRRIVEAQHEHVDAVVIDCMGDPGLRAARELVSIPVVGPAELSLHTAAMLGETFSIVTVLERLRPAFARSVRSHGLADRVASFRAIELPVLEIGTNLELVTRLLCEESIRAVRDDHAAVIVLGCTGFVGVAKTIESLLRTETGMRIPVIEPLPLSILTAAAWVTAGISHSQTSQPS